MTATTPPAPAGGPLRGIAPQPASGPSGVGRAAQAGDGAAFRALLERLEQRAGALEERSRSELGPGDLPTAVDEARASLQEALRLSSELLEAWRQSRHQGGSRPGSRA